MFDAFAQDYRRHARESPYNAYYDRPAVLGALGPVNGLRVLDAGCGPGLYAAELVARGAAFVQGIDISPEMICLAEEAVRGPVTFRVHDLAQPLDWLEAASFDAAVMALVIHHLDDRVRALQEIARVLGSGGRLVVSTHHPTGDWPRRGGSYFAVEIDETWSRGTRKSPRGSHSNRASSCSGCARPDPAQPGPVTVGKQRSRWTGGRSIDLVGLSGATDRRRGP